MAPDAPERRRRLGVLLGREGVRPNPKKRYRLYREAGLAVRRRHGHPHSVHRRLPPAAAGERPRNPDRLHRSPAPRAARERPSASSDSRAERGRHREEIGLGCSAAPAA